MTRHSWLYMLNFQQCFPQPTVLFVDAKLVFERPVPRVADAFFAEWLFAAGRLATTFLAAGRFAAGRFAATALAAGRFAAGRFVTERLAAGPVAARLFADGRLAAAPFDAGRFTAPLGAMAWVNWCYLSLRVRCHDLNECAFLPDIARRRLQHHVSSSPTQVKNQTQCLGEKLFEKLPE